MSGKANQHEDLLRKTAGCPQKCSKILGSDPCVLLHWDRLHLWIPLYWDGSQANRRHLLQLNWDCPDAALPRSCRTHTWTMRSWPMLTLWTCDDGCQRYSRISPTVKFLSLCEMSKSSHTNNLTLPVIKSLCSISVKFSSRSFLYKKRSKNEHTFYGISFQ